jgi:hypothetical protein
MEIQLNGLYHEILAQLRDAEQKAAELRGQLMLIERLIRESQQPIMSGDALHGEDDHAEPTA